MCVDTDFQYNQATAQEVTITGTGIGACGINHSYANNTGSYAGINGAWQGGWIPSGNEWITSAGVAASKPPAEPKISAAEAIRTGQVRMGSPTGPKATRAQLNRKPGASAAGIPLMDHKNIQVSEQ
ncbi:hypothetical protein ACFRCI_40405 [Streptomyces sp. NPDC056638]|uniref:hypothetical protein n=1 Tax=Streptomyces sp. NPDC056638 TaxID=3345887 RepID=UPI0036A368FD